MAGKAWWPEHEPAGPALIHRKGAEGDEHWYLLSPFPFSPGWGLQLTKCRPLFKVDFLTSLNLIVLWTCPEVCFLGDGDSHYELPQ